MHNVNDKISVISAECQDETTPYVHPWTIAAAILSGATFIISLMVIVVIALK